MKAVLAGLAVSIGCVGVCTAIKMSVPAICLRDMEQSPRVC
jgi:hypothetical protein